MMIVSRSAWFFQFIVILILADGSTGSRTDPKYTSQELPKPSSLHPIGSPTSDDLHHIGWSSFPSLQNAKRNLTEMLVGNT